MPLQSDPLIPFPTFEPQSFRAEVGVKRSADVLSDNLYQTMFCKRPAMEIPFPFLPFNQPVFQFPAPSESKSFLKRNGGLLIDYYALFSSLNSGADLFMLKT